MAVATLRSLPVHPKLWSQWISLSSIFNRSSVGAATSSIREYVHPSSFLRLLRQPDAPQQVREPRILTQAVPDILLSVERSESTPFDSAIQPMKGALLFAQRGVDLGNVVGLAEAGPR